MVAADLLSDHGWDDAVKGCQYVLHVASPFVVGVPKDENELIVPAVQGTTRVVEAAIREGVKRVVLTSSCAAITETGKAGQTQFSEDDWTDASHPATPAYYKSKVLAERKAWSSLEHRIKPSSPLSILLGSWVRCCPAILAHRMRSSGRSSKDSCLGVLKCIWASSTFVMLLRPTYWR